MRGYRIGVWFRCLLQAERERKKRKLGFFVSLAEDLAQRDDVRVVGVMRVSNSWGTRGERERWGKTTM